jgi:uncharacterized protein YbjT (DUF2867 family)
MSESKILVLGATGQQGGAVVGALTRAGWGVRALVRDPQSEKSRKLQEAAVETVKGDLRDPASIHEAMKGIYGVFCVLPSSGQPQYGISDQDEIEIGKIVADAALQENIAHFVYSSTSGAGPETGLGHLDSKWSIEEHIRSIGLTYTILRPAGFMENLLWPVCGLAEHKLRYFGKPDQTIQLIAVNDIGKFALAVFADPAAHVGRTHEIAGDDLSGNNIAEQISRITRRHVDYEQLPSDNPFFRSILDYFEKHGGGSANLEALRTILPDLLTFEAWLDATGKAQIETL